MPYNIQLQEDVLYLELAADVLDTDIAALVQALEDFEKALQANPNRILDLRQANLSHVTSCDIRAAAGRRNGCPLPKPHRTAIVAQSALQFGLARMLEAMIVNPQIDVRLFKDINEAEAWVRSKRQSPAA